MQSWDLWFPDAAARGLPFARGRMDATKVLLVRAAPETLNAEVRDDAGRLLARGERLGRTADTPMLRLTVRGGAIARGYLARGGGHRPAGAAAGRRDGHPQGVVERARRAEVALAGGVLHPPVRADLADPTPPRRRSAAPPLAVEG